MYSKSSWSGAVDPFVLVKFIPPEEGSIENLLISLVLFEWKDKPLIGKQVSDDPSAMRDYICSPTAVTSGLCNETHLGEFILADDAQDVSKNQILTQAIDLKDPPAIRYPVTKTGYYCVGTWSESPEYTAIVEFRNAYGELAAAQIPKLPFYGGLTIAYAVMVIFWAFLYVQNRHDILPVQNYITAILVFLVVEMLMTWGFYDYTNRHGTNAGSRALLVIVSVLNAGRNSFSFFLLLIVCMGYGVVKPSLGKNMVYVRWLAAAHFLFGVIYAVASLTIHPENAGPLVLLVILPLSATLTAFYIWTLNSLNMTIKDLIARKQHVKASMYKNLWYCILTTILVIFGFFFFNSFTFAGYGDDDFAPSHWRSRWFILDGWLNIVYFAVVAFISYLWRPTANNRRFAMSDEIAQDDEGFEIASMRSSLDEEDGGYSHNESTGQQFEGLRSTPAGASVDRSRSPLPAPKPQRPATLPRESLDGETIFAVGDEDKWSDDEDDEGHGDESKRLTGKTD
ncbi:hypothetical protein P152DRAFT_185273 [Eremomyces bilateralis CBS 781.70]|uniref:Integral membrane protein n=1 Tax=Eremomyces bilateralis CBS 781.70 TaxID=1392243 RepID=A0A6G1GC57_9PEZI|nr:uncharacterized protein P152DRAFT_185273 [Eremomyces bilateralis CBS 781.70]KAF1815429.1 hypothetical protein P152DRAFT_185273 [Eremomyces bilateralis CBS 781.70]